MPVINITTYEDAYVDEGVPTTPQSPTNWLNAGELTNPPPLIQNSVGITRAWGKFDLTAIPVGATINSISLDIYVFYPHDNYVPTTFDVERETAGTWDATTITWNNAPNATLENPLDYAALQFTIDSQGVDKFNYVVSGLAPMVRRARLLNNILSIRIRDDIESDGAGISITSLQFPGPAYPGYYPMTLVVDYTPAVTPPTGKFLKFRGFFTSRLAPLDNFKFTGVGRGFPVFTGLKNKRLRGKNNNP